MEEAKADLGLDPRLQEMKQSATEFIPRDNNRHAKCVFAVQAVHCMNCEEV